VLGVELPETLFPRGLLHSSVVALPTNFGATALRDVADARANDARGDSGGAGGLGDSQVRSYAALPVLPPGPRKPFESSHRFPRSD